MLSANLNTQKLCNLIHIQMDTMEQPTFPHNHDIEEVFYYNKPKSDQSFYSRVIRKRKSATITSNWD